MMTLRIAFALIDTGARSRSGVGTARRHYRRDLSGSVPAMAILVDQAVWPWRGRRWAHLVSDESYDELHAFAARLGLPRHIFQGDHYDVPADVRDDAIA